MYVYLCVCHLHDKNKQGTPNLAHNLILGLSCVAPFRA